MLRSRGCAAVWHYARAEIRVGTTCLSCGDSWVQSHEGEESEREPSKIPTLRETLGPVIEHDANPDRDRRRYNTACLQRIGHGLWCGRVEKHDGACVADLPPDASSCTRVPSEGSGFVWCGRPKDHVGPCAAPSPHHDVQRDVDKKFVPDTPRFVPFNRGGWTEVREKPKKTDGE